MTDIGIRSQFPAHFYQMNLLSFHTKMDSTFASGQTSTAMHIPMWIAYASVPVGCTLMAFRLLQNAYFAIRNYKKEKEAD